MRRKFYNGLSVILIFLSTLVFSACSGSDDKESDTSLVEAVVGSWYYSTDNYIYSLDVMKNGAGSLIVYVYDDKQWLKYTSSLQYAISENTVTVKLQDEEAWSGFLAVTGNSMSITRATDVLMFTRFDGNVGNLKKEIEENILDDEPSYVVPEESYYQSEEDVKAVLNALYTYLRAYEYKQVNLESIRIYGVDLNNNPQSITPSLDEVESTWQAAYKVIIMANTISNALQSSSMEKYLPYLNEALAIRSLVYYNIANLWGNIPYTESSNSLDYPPVYTYEQVIGAVKETLSSIETFNNEDCHINKGTVKALLGEIALCENNKAAASEYLENSFPDFSIAINETEEPGMYKLLGEKIPNYTSDIVRLLRKEAKSETNNIVSDWQSLGPHVWGYWLMLKRTGNAVAVCNCQEYELLMPVPNNEISVNPTLLQNPGY